MKTLATLTLVALLSAGSAMATNTFMSNDIPMTYDTNLNKDPMALIYQNNTGKIKSKQNNTVIGIGNSAYNDLKVNSVKLKTGLLNALQFNTGKVDSHQSNAVLGIGNAVGNAASANSIEMGCTTC